MVTVAEECVKLFGPNWPQAEVSFFFETEARRDVCHSASGDSKTLCSTLDVLKVWSSRLCGRVETASFIWRAAQIPRPPLPTPPSTSTTVFWIQSSVQRQVHINICPLHRVGRCRS